MAALATQLQMDTHSLLSLRVDAIVNLLLLAAILSTPFLLRLLICGKHLLSSASKEQAL
jgi:hypothetical protein